MGGWSMNKLLGVIVGMLTIVVTLAIAPSIATANAAVQAANQTNLIGLSVVDDFGAPLAVLGLLAMAGVFTVGAWKSTTSMKDMMTTIFTAVIVIVGLTFMSSIITYTNALIGATATDFEDTIWGIIPLFVYLTVIGLAGWQTYKGSKKLKGSKKSAGAVGF